jgi:hypothetical protein
MLLLEGINAAIGSFDLRPRYAQEFSSQAFYVQEALMLVSWP